VDALPHSNTALGPGEPALAIVQAVLRSPDGTTPRFRSVGGPEPTFLLPADIRVATRVCRGYNGLRAPRRRLQRSALAWALRAGLGRWATRDTADIGRTIPGLPPDRSLAEELERRLGCPLRVGVGLGEVDSWWKPVLQLFDPVGRPVAFAKVGWTLVTTGLVDNEGTSLERVRHGLVDTVVPQPLHHFDWGPLRVLVTAPLPSDTRRLRPAETVEPPDDLVAALGTVSAPLAESSWWNNQLRLITAAEHAVEVAEPLVRYVLAVADRFGARPVQLGVCHGDWVPWNLGRTTDGALVVWDWEYASVDAPVGLDAVHGRYQVARLLDGLDDHSAMALAHRDVESPLPELHATMVAARRCAAATAGAMDDRGLAELSAATSTLARRCRTQP
jgi:hypothetical protein